MFIVQAQIMASEGIYISNVTFNFAKKFRSPFLTPFHGDNFVTKFKKKRNANLFICT